MKSSSARFLALALMIGCAPAWAVCSSSTRVCRDTITKISVNTSGGYSVFVTAGDHEILPCTNNTFPNCFGQSTCTDTDGFDLNTSDAHYKQAAQALQIAASGFLTVELTIDTACNIDTVLVDP